MIVIFAKNADIPHWDLRILLDFPIFRFEMVRLFSKWIGTRLFLLLKRILNQSVKKFRLCYSSFAHVCMGKSFTYLNQRLSIPQLCKPCTSKYIEVQRTPEKFIIIQTFFLCCGSGFIELIDIAF